MSTRFQLAIPQGYFSRAGLIAADSVGNFVAAWFQRLAGRVAEVGERGGIEIAFKEAGSNTAHRQL
jgi:hypothetical protein